MVATGSLNQSETKMTEQMKKSLASRKARRTAAEVADKLTAKQPKAPKPQDK